MRVETVEGAPLFVLQLALAPPDGARPSVFALHYDVILSWS